MQATSMTVSQARAALPQIVQRVLDGEEITLTRHGEAVAVVIRPDRLRERRADAALAGAAAVHQALTTGKDRPLGSLPRARAQELLDEVERSRASR